MNSIEQTIAEVVRSAVDDALARHQTVEKVAWSMTEVAESLGVSPDIVRRLVAEGHLPTVETGTRRILVPVVAVRAFAAAGGAPQLRSVAS